MAKLDMKTFKDFNVHSCPKLVPCNNYEKPFGMGITSEELMRMCCTHKNEDGTTALIKNADDSYTCPICHKEFRICEDDPVKIQKDIDRIVKLLSQCGPGYAEIPKSYFSGPFRDPKKDAKNN